MTDHADSATSDTVSSQHESLTDSSIAVASIRDITSVNIDQLDGDSIEQLQRVLRRLQRRSDDDDVDDDASDGQMMSGCEKLHPLASGQCISIQFV